MFVCRPNAKQKWPPSRDSCAFLTVCCNGEYRSVEHVYCDVYRFRRGRLASVHARVRGTNFADDEAGDGAAAGIAGEAVGGGGGGGDTRPGRGRRRRGTGVEKNHLKTNKCPFKHPSVFALLDQR
jgi:hypothetical protein